VYIRLKGDVTHNNLRYTVGDELEIGDIDGSRLVRLGLAVQIITEDDIMVTEPIKPEKPVKEESPGVDFEEFTEKAKKMPYTDLVRHLEGLTVTTICQDLGLLGVPFKKNYPKAQLVKIYLEALGRDSRG